MTNKPETGFYGWINAALLFFLYLTTTGLIFYGFVSIFPVMIKTMAWSRGEASIAMSVNGILWGALTPLTALCMARFGIKKTIFSGLLILLAGLLLLGTVTTKLWQWTLIWGVMMGMGLALCGFMPLQTIIMNWFNIKRAAVIGLVAAGAPVGGFLAQPFFTRLLIKTQSWQIGWLTAAGFALLAVVACWFVRTKPEEIGQHQDGLAPGKGGPDSAGQKPVALTYRADGEWTLKAAIATPTLYFAMAASVAYLMPLLMITTHGILHLTDLGISNIEAASVLSLALLGSGVSRLPAGWLGDRIEPRWIITVSLVVLLGSMLVIWKVVDVKALMIFGFLFGCGYGSCLVLIPTMLGNYYGPEAFPRIMGFISPFLILFDSGVAVGAGVIADKTGTYDLAFMILSVFIALGITGAGLCAPPVRKKAVTAPTGGEKS